MCSQKIVLVFLGTVARKPALLVGFYYWGRGGSRNVKAY